MTVKSFEKTTARLLQRTMEIDARCVRKPTYNACLSFVRANLPGVRQAMDRDESEGPHEGATDRLMALAEAHFLEPHVVFPLEKS